MAGRKASRLVRARKPKIAGVERREASVREDAWHPLVPGARVMGPDLPGARAPERRSALRPLFSGGT